MIEENEIPKDDDQRFISSYWLNTLLTTTIIAIKYLGLGVYCLRLSTQKITTLQDFVGMGTN